MVVNIGSVDSSVRRLTVYANRGDGCDILHITDVNL